jgi:hypothetical protein
MQSSISNSKFTIWDNMTQSGAHIKLTMLNLLVVFCRRSPEFFFEVISDGSRSESGASIIFSLIQAQNARYVIVHINCLKILSLVSVAQLMKRESPGP